MQLLPGAGAVEIELARRIDSIAEKMEGLDQYAVQQFARALEVFPKLLAENAGLKVCFWLYRLSSSYKFQATEALSTLRAAHEAGQTSQGVEVLSGKIVNAVESNVLDLFAAKNLALKLASDAASTVLIVDQIIMAKPAGGPPVKGPKAQDEDDTMA